MKPVFEVLPVAVLKDGAVLCPKCWKKLCEYGPGAVAKNLVLWCRGCKHPVLVDI